MSGQTRYFMVYSFSEVNAVDVLEGLNAAMKHIEAHLHETPDLEQAARLASHSADGFLRTFSYLTGISVSEYIRRRRLTQAAYDLQQGQTVLDTALRWGYNNPDAFRRAFFKQHGIVPSAARRPAVHLNITPPLTFRIDFTGGKEMDFRIVEFPELKLMGVSKVFEGPAAERFEQEHIMWADHHDNAPGLISEEYPGVWYGIWDNGTYWIARKPEDTCNSNLEVITVPGGTYAVFQTGYGGFAGDELPRLRAQIFDAWLTSSDYKHVCDYEVEVYHLAPKQEKDKRYYEIWIPVKHS